MESTGDTADGGNDWMGDFCEDRSHFAADKSCSPQQAGISQRPLDIASVEEAEVERVEVDSCCWTYDKMQLAEEASDEQLSEQAEADLRQVDCNSSMDTHRDCE